MLRDGLGYLALSESRLRHRCLPNQHYRDSSRSRAHLFAKWHCRASNALQGAGPLNREHDKAHVTVANPNAIFTTLAAPVETSRIGKQTLHLIIVSSSRAAMLGA